MNSKSDYKEFVQKTWNSLKDFQKDTVSYVFEQLYKNNRDKMLVADEVGLGKTIVAKGVIAKAFERFRPNKYKPSFNVIYICSNQVLAKENIKKLNFTGNDEVTKDPLNRLLYLAFKENKQKQLLKFDSLTPATSLTITVSPGAIRERAILYALLAHYEVFKRRKLGLKYLLIGGAGLANWEREMNHHYLRKEDLFRNDIFKKFKEILFKTKITKSNAPRFYKFLGQKTDLSVWNGLMEICGAINHRNHKSFPFKNEIIVLLRHLLTKVCLEYLNADLIILDEFQRYSEILGSTSEEKVSPAIELAQAVFDLKHTKVLMLSATPFKPYTIQQEEDNGESHYEEFKRVLKFLMKKQDDSFWAQFENDRRLFFNALRSPKDALAELPKTKKVKKRLEDTYRDALVRTERMLVSEDHNAMIKSEINKPLSICKEDIEDFIVLDKIGQYLKDTERFNSICPIEYNKSCPFPLSFAEHYTFKKNLEALLDDEDFRSFLKTCKQAWINLNDINSYKALGNGDGKSKVPNAKMQQLIDDAVDSGSWKWLWIPPTINYYKPESVYPIAPGFSKTLIFSSWVMVPRSISTILSYEAERLAIKKYYDLIQEEAPGEYFSDVKQRKPRPLLTFKYNNEAKRSLSLSLFTLLYPSEYLREVYDPEVNLIESLSMGAVVSKVASMIQQQFDRLGLSKYITKGGESEKWYWATPVLLDVAFSKDHKQKVADFLYSLLGEKTDFVSDEYRRDEELTGQNEIKHIKELMTFVNDPSSFNLGQIPNDLFEVMAYICLASPSVAFSRSLKKILKAEDKDAFTFSYKYAIAKNHFFNKPDSIAIVRGSFSNETTYWKAVLKYAFEGNIQSSLDEYISLLSENEESVKNIQSHISDVLSIKTVNIKVDDYNTFTTKETKRIRTNFAVDFGNQNLETSTGTGRVLNMRQAFNSPYRPFILASTSIGQEGLDFHYYCGKIIHWNLPSNAIDIEQREGRINRYKGLVIRANIASKYLDKVKNHYQLGDLWEALYQQAWKEEGEGKKKCQLVPFWHVEPKDDIKIERIVPLYPFSKDISKYKVLNETLTYYRLTFGQPRQEELMESFFRNNLSEEELKLLRDNLLIDLRPKVNRFGS